MSPPVPKKNDGVECSSGCCGAGTPPAQVEHAEKPSDARPTSIKSTKSLKSAEEQFTPSCCGSVEQDAVKFVAVVAENEAGACASGCCGGSAIQASATRGDNTIAHAQCGFGDCNESSCLAATGPTEEEPAKDDCAGGCCSTKPISVAIGASKADNCNDGCCGSVKSEKVRKSKECKDACYSSTKTSINSAENCCDGKPKPCCDEDCVERLVIRECNAECIERGAKGRKCKTRSSASSDGSADCCPNGITARRFYRELLRSLGCLCGAAKARSGATCCNVASEASLNPMGNTRRACVNENLRRPNRGRLPPFPKADTCGSDCDDDCCTVKPRATSMSKEKKFPEVGIRGTSGLTPSSLEDGVAENGHVALSVSGMTCVGCEAKLQRSLATIKAVQNLKTSLILCRAEFDLDRRYETVDSIIHQLQRMTEFKYEELKQDGSEIEVCPPDVKSFVQQDLPIGVFSLQAVDKTTVRISYDPSIVGARDLVEQKFDIPLSIAPIKPDPGLAAGSKHVRHVGLMTLLSAALTIPVLVLAWASIHERPIVYGGVSLALATLVQFVIAGPFYPTALKSLIFARMIEMDLLIVISTSAAYIFSVVAFGYLVAGKPLATGEFFETSTLLVTLIMVGRWISALARQKAVESVSLRSLQTPTAVLVGEKDETTREIDTRLLQYGDIFRVAPESRIPTDGTVIGGVSEIDESMITGESLPVDKQPGTVVIAGSVNGSGVLTVRLSRLPGDNTISVIANMVDEAKLSKPKIQDVADKVASYFVPTAIALALLVFIIWIPIGLKVRQYDGSRAVTEALTYAITVIIVSCPCAIGLAVPMVIVIAGGVAARHGCIFKTATTIEIARKTSHVVFDKTGTLTEGQLTVAAKKYFLSEPPVAAAVYALVSNIKHPVSLAVEKSLKGKITSGQKASDVTSHTGKGVQGTVNGKVVKAGNSRWLGLDDHPAVKDFLSQGYTTLCATVDGKIAAIFGLQDSLRSDARQTVAELQRRSIEVSIVSGDDEGPVSVVARQLGITSIRSKCTPADKMQFMKDLTDAGKITIFCGDGTNDAVALAQATIGVHMNEGTDVAQSAADVVLVRSSLIDILTLIDLSKASMLRIAFNFGWSFVYNTLAILFSSGALVEVRILPEFAGLGELISVLPVVAIAMQLRRVKFSKTPTME